MSTIIISFLRKYWAQWAVAAMIGALSGVAHVEHVKFKSSVIKLAAAAALHQEDVQRIASLAKDLTDQNVAIGELQAAQAKKEQKVDKALVTAKVQEQKIVTLLAPTNNKKIVSCEAAMPDVRNILKGLAE